MLPLLHLVTRTGPELARMAMAGQISRDDLWVAYEGAERWAQAIARGDIADAHVQEARAGICEQCPALVRTETGSGVTLGWCGGVLAKGVSKTGPDGGGPTCGCQVTINGKPAGKTIVMSAACTRGEW